MVEEKQYIQEDEITLKELIEKIQEYALEVWKNWKIVLLVCAIFLAYKIYDALTDIPQYSAELTFMVNEDDGGGFGGINAVLGQFGLGKRGGGKYNLDKILELAKSRRIVQMILFEKGTINEKTDFYANHLIEEYKYREKWAEDEDTRYLADFRFTHDSLEQFTDVENMIFKNLYSLIKGSEDEVGILITDYNKDTGIMNLKFKTSSPGLSLQLCNVLYDKLSKYYIEKTIEKQQTTYRIIKSKADSLGTLAKASERAWARFKDSNRGLWTATAELKELQLKKDVEMYNVMHLEALKNLEFADFSLRNKTPFVQLIDAPIAPLSPSQKSLILSAIIGLILGGMIAVSFIIARKLYRDVMAV